MAIVLHETQRAVFYAPFYAAFTLGAYKAEGVDVEFSSSSNPADAASLLYSGGADVSWGGPMRVMLTYEREADADLVAFCEVVTRDPFFLVGREPCPNFSFAALAGKKVGIVKEVPTPWLCMQQDVRDQGVDPASLDLHADLAMAENAAALRRGERDVVHVLEPFATELVEEGAGHIWYTPATRGPTAYTCFYTRRSILENRRAEFVLMTRAIARTLTWIASAEPMAIAEALAEFFPDMDRKLLAAAMARYQRLGIWGATPVLSREGFERLKASIISGGLVKHGQPFGKIIDNSLAEEVVRAGLAPLKPA